MKARAPMFCNPIEFSIQAAVSNRGGDDHRILERDAGKTHA